jgi:MoxR-like ATPase
MNEREIDDQAKRVGQLQEAIARVFVGRSATISTLLLGFMSGLHVLVEDVPGVGKTTLARALAAGAGLDFARIQFTPDLLPGDIIGMTVWSQEAREFTFKPGAIMHQFVLADELNRASPRTQSSLLEAMQEGSVSVDGRTYHLPQPFFVIATQNPAEFLGAFRLPEGELDRFGVSLSIGYPGEQDEQRILERFQDRNPLEEVTPVTTAEQVIETRRLVQAILVSEKVRLYIIQIMNKTRGHRYIKLGASPRAAQHLQTAAQSRALVQRRSFVIPEDVIDVALAVLSHRLVLSAEARMEKLAAPEIVRRIVAECPIPTGVS